MHQTRAADRLEGKTDCVIMGSAAVTASELLCLSITVLHRDVIFIPWLIGQ